MRFILLILSFITLNVNAETFTGSILSVNQQINYKIKEKFYSWKVVKVIDGDTLEVIIPSFPDELNPVKIRVKGIDTPEKLRSLAKCENEIILAKQATEFTKIVIFKAIDQNRPIMFSNISWDKYGRRIDADVYIENSKLSDMLIKNGFAKPYNGNKKINWCN